MLLVPEHTILALYTTSYERTSFSAHDGKILNIADAKSKFGMASSGLGPAPSYRCDAAVP